MLIPQHAAVFERALRAIHRKTPTGFKRNVRQGLSFPDLSCPTFHIAVQDGLRRLEKKLRVCPMFRMLFVGTKGSKDSLMDETHNGWRAVMHAMAPSDGLTVRQVQLAAVRAIVLSFFAAMFARDRAVRQRWLGVAMHTMQDAWSPSHTLRDEPRAVDQVEDKSPSLDEVLAAAEPVLRKVGASESDGDSATSDNSASESTSRLTRRAVLTVLSDGDNRAALWKKMTLPGTTAGAVLGALAEMSGTEVFQSVRSKSFDELPKGLRRLFKLTADILFDEQMAQQLLEAAVAAAEDASTREVATTETAAGRRSRPRIRKFYNFARQAEQGLDVLHATLDCLPSVTKAGFRWIQEGVERDTAEMLQLFFAFEDGERAGRRWESLVDDTIRKLLAFLISGPLAIDPDVADMPVGDVKANPNSAWNVFGTALGNRGRFAMDMQCVGETARVAVFG